MANARKKNFPPPKAPRELAAIESEAAEVIGKAGNLQYQLVIYKEELDRLNNRLRELNYEAAARNKLDAETKTKEQKEGSNE